MPFDKTKPCLPAAKHAPFVDRLSFKPDGFCRFLNEIGTVSPAQQRAELFGDKQATVEGKLADTATVAAPKDSQAKKVE